MKMTVRFVSVLFLLACFLRVSFASPFDQDGYLFVANQEHLVAKDYVPPDLVTPKVPTRKQRLQKAIDLRHDAAKQLERMFYMADVEQGIRLLAVSGYRSYGIQQINFSSKVKAVGNKEIAAKTVAVPGTSEHQLGLAMDIQSSTFHGLDARFQDTKEGRWLAKNSARFGFILRYKQAWQETTGIVAEPWHFRYVGVNHALAMDALDVPLETYAALVRAIPESHLDMATHVLLVHWVKLLQTGVQPIYYPGQSQEELLAWLKEQTEPLLENGQRFDQVYAHNFPFSVQEESVRVERPDEELSLFSSGTN